MYPLITAVLSAIVIASLIYLFRRWEMYAERTLKIMTVVFCLLGLFRYLLADGFVETEMSFAHPLQSFLRWGYYIGYSVLPMAVFTQSRLFRNIATYFSSAMALLSIAHMNTTMAHFFDGNGYGYTLTPAWRYIFYITELVLALSIPVVMAVQRKHIIDIHDRKELFHIALGLPAILLQMMPAYIPQALLGWTDIPYGSFSPFHLGWIALIVVECVVLYLYFRKRSETDKYNLLRFLVIAQVFHTMSIFLRGFTLSRMPIQLCSIAAFFYFVAIITKNRTLFGFCFLTNIVGALVAIVLAAFDVGALYFFTIHYMFEHAFVVLMPVLALSLGVFPRLTRADLGCALGVFTIYFFGCYSSGLLINYLSMTDPNVYTVNYFYMFNYNVALKYLPFATFTGAIEIPLGKMNVYPILIFVIYTAFVLLISGFFGFMKGFYKIKDLLSHKTDEPLPTITE